MAPTSDGVPVEPTERVAIADNGTSVPRTPSSAGRRGGAACSAPAFAAGWRLPVRRVLLGNGLRLCPQCPLPDDREGFLERAVRDVAARAGGTPHRRTTPGGRSVKPPGRHACCQVWEVRLPGGVAVASLTVWNQGRRVAVPYIWIQARYGLVLQIARLFNP